MSINCRFVSLEQPVGLRTKRSKFDSTYSATLDQLEGELRKLEAKNVVIQAGFRSSQIRNDGWPYSGARPLHSAVVLSFTAAGKGDLSFPCSTYDKYEDNLRAITLSLEALRAVDRYGVTRRAEQYQGWTALPPGQSVPSLTRHSAAIWLAGVSGVVKDSILDHEGAREEAYKIAARKLHPDAGGSHEEFVELGRVMKSLRTEGGSV